MPSYPFSTFGLHHVPFNSAPRLSEVRWASSVPWPIVVIQPLYELGKYLLRTSHQYSPRCTSSEMPLPLLSTISGLHPPIETIVVYFVRFYKLHTFFCYGLNFMNVYLGSCDFFVLLIKAVIFWLIKLLLCVVLLKNLNFLPYCKSTI